MKNLIRKIRIHFLKKKNKYIGNNVTIWYPVNIFDSYIHHHVSIGAFTDIGGSSIGAYTRIGPNCAIPRGTVIESIVFLGQGVVICNDKYPSVPKALERKSKPDCSTSVYIKTWAVIGANVTILPNIHIGRGAVVGAGSVVTKDIMDYDVVCGNPAKSLKIKKEKNVI